MCPYFKLAINQEENVNSYLWRWLIAPNSLLAAAVLSGCATGIDLSSYPTTWPPLNVTDSGKCESLYDTYGPLEGANGDGQFRVIADRLLRTEAARKEAVALRIAPGKQDPEFLEITAYGKDAVLETSPIRALCKDGVISLWPAKTEKVSSSNNYFTIVTNNVPVSGPMQETQVRTNWQSHFYLAGKADVVMAEPTKECMRRMVVGREVERKCRDMTNWYRMKRIASPGKAGVTSESESGSEHSSR